MRAHIRGHGRHARRTRYELVGPSPDPPIFRRYRLRGAARVRHDRTD
ncbi:hypothetical protein MBEHAL_1970 [Halarchaeum acidiphilum MH1-52-1]|uniref:Uncharacterized protein n=1 Tax=Halarchaeum acidiphilum MH1-52-1 TaxID=1261545 RepID=U2YW06_9EURY|nr:hypothetical protein MBEHAL_1970 [Halarchaeum acidiphilum MH1-52-1]